MTAIAHMATFAGYRHIATATHAGTTNISTNTNAYTFSSHAIGTASADRVVVVMIMGGLVTTAASVSSVTIGGNAATLHGTQIDATPKRPKQAMAGLLVTAGTTADVVVNWTQTLESCQISVWALTGTGGIFLPAVRDVRAVNTGGGTVSTNALIIPPNGAVIAAAMFIDTTAGTNDITWTGPTEASDIAGETASGRMGSAGLSNQAFSSGFTVQAVINGGLDADLGSSLYAASFLGV